MIIFWLSPFIVIAAVLIWGLNQYWKLQEVKQSLCQYLRRARFAAKNSSENSRVHYDAVILSLETILSKNFKDAQCLSKSLRSDRK